MKLHRWLFECRKCHAALYVHKRKPYAKGGLYGWRIVTLPEATRMTNELGWNNGICELCKRGGVAA